MRSLRSRIVMGLGLAAASVLPASRAMAGISIDPSSSINAFAGNVELGTNATDNPSTIPYNKTTTANDMGGTSAVMVNLSDGAFLTNFNANLINPFDYTSGNAQLIFTPDADLAYSLSGSNSESGASSFHSFSVDLTDLNTKAHLFTNLQNSFDTQDETLTLGSQGGNMDNSLAGSMTGTLLANHQYSLSIATEADGVPTLTLLNELPFNPGSFTPSVMIPMGVTSSGSVTLGLASTTTAVPLPPAAWMGLITLVAVGAFLKLRRNAAIA